MRDALLNKEQALTRKLKGEIVKAKDVLLSTELSVQAHTDLKKLVSLNDEDKVFLEDGSIRDLMEANKQRLMNFEYEKNNSKHF